jgi:hypothetical protein
MEDARETRSVGRDRQGSRRAVCQTRRPWPARGAVHSVFSPTRFGGWRAWFRCPGCFQGCRVLYGVNSLRCRKCRRLKYQSQYEGPGFRLLGRAYKIRRRLGKSGASGDPQPPKPRYMRWRTYSGLARLLLRLENAGWAVIMAHVSAFCGRRRRKSGVQLRSPLPHQVDDHPLNGSIISAADNRSMAQDP